MLLHRAIKLTGGRRQRKIDRCLSRVNASDIEASRIWVFSLCFTDVRRKGCIHIDWKQIRYQAVFWKFDVLFILIGGNDRKLFVYNYVYSRTEKNSNLNYKLSVCPLHYGSMRLVKFSSRLLHNKKGHQRYEKTGLKERIASLTLCNRLRLLSPPDPPSFSIVQPFQWK